MIGIVVVNEGPRTPEEIDEEIAYLDERIAEMDAEIAHQDALEDAQLGDLDEVAENTSAEGSTGMSTLTQAFIRAFDERVGQEPPASVNAERHHDWCHGIAHAACDVKRAGGMSQEELDTILDECERIWAAYIRGERQSLLVQEYIARFKARLDEGPIYVAAGQDQRYWYCMEVVNDALTARLEGKLRKRDFNEISDAAHALWTERMCEEVERAEYVA